jgi:hypothetical protein
MTLNREHIQSHIKLLIYTRMMNFHSSEFKNSILIDVILITAHSNKNAKTDSV